MGLHLGTHTITKNFHSSLFPKCTLCDGCSVLTSPGRTNHFLFGFCLPCTFSPPKFQEFLSSNSSTNYVTFLPRPLSSPVLQGYSVVPNQISNKKSYCISMLRLSDNGMISKIFKFYVHGYFACRCFGASHESLVFLEATADVRSPITRVKNGCKLLGIEPGLLEEKPFRFISSHLSISIRVPKL